MKRFGGGEGCRLFGRQTLMIVADRNFEDHCNRFIRFWLYSVMKLFLAFFVLMTAQAMSLKDFNTKYRPAKDGNSAAQPRTPRRCPMPPPVARLWDHNQHGRRSGR